MAGVSIDLRIVFPVPDVAKPTVVGVVVIAKSGVVVGHVGGVLSDDFGSLSTNAGQLLKRPVVGAAGATGLGDQRVDLKR